MLLIIFFIRHHVGCRIFLRNLWGKNRKELCFEFCYGLVVIAMGDGVHRGGGVADDGGSNGNEGGPVVALVMGRVKGNFRYL